MKNLYFLLFILYFNLGFSQINSSSTWTYGEFDWFGGYQKGTLAITIEKDTLIDGQTWYIESSESLPIRYSNGIMEYHYEGAGHKLYDFNLDIGDTLKIYWPFQSRNSPISDTIYCVVEEYGIDNIQGEDCPYQLINSVYPHENDGSDYEIIEKVYDGIGYSNSLFPYYYRVADGDYLRLLCYELDDEIKHVLSDDCEHFGFGQHFVDCELIFLEDKICIPTFSPEVIEIDFDLGQELASRPTVIWHGDYQGEDGERHDIREFLRLTSGAPEISVRRIPPPLADSIVIKVTVFDIHLNRCEDNTVLYFPDWDCLTNQDYTIEKNCSDTVQLFAPCVEANTTDHRYSWSPNYNISDTSVENPQVWPEVDTDYNITIFDKNGCSTQGLKFEVKCLLNTAETQNASPVTAYPNPVGDILFIDDYELVHNIKITDPTGYEREIAPSSQIDFSKFKEGIYFIRFELLDGTRKTQKLIKR